MRLRDVSYDSADLGRKELEAFHRNKSPESTAKLDKTGEFHTATQKNSLCIQKLAHKRDS